MLVQKGGCSSREREREREAPPTPFTAWSEEPGTVPAHSTTRAGSLQGFNPYSNTAIPSAASAKENVGPACWWPLQCLPFLQYRQYKRRKKKIKYYIIWKIVWCRASAKSWGVGGDAATTSRAGRLPMQSASQPTEWPGAARVPYSTVQSRKEKSRHLPAVTTAREDNYYNTLGTSQSVTKNPTCPVNTPRQLGGVLPLHLLQLHCGYSLCLLQGECHLGTAPRLPPGSSLALIPPSAGLGRQHALSCVSAVALSLGLARGWHAALLAPAGKKTRTQGLKTRPTLLTHMWHHVDEPYEHNNVAKRHNYVLRVLFFFAIITYFWPS